MAKIILAENIFCAHVPVTGKVLGVYSKDFHDLALPSNHEIKYIGFEDFRGCAREMVKGIDSLVFFGLNKAITPGNRTDDVWELLFNQTPHLNKISVDNTLFVSEPWRAWFHFGLTGCKYRDYTYSYIAESHYKAYQDGVREEDPFSLKELLHWSSGVVYSDYYCWFSHKVVWLPVSEAVKAEYAKEKELAFDEESTVNAIMNRLADFAAVKFPNRNVPSLKQWFSRRNHWIVASELPIDRWLVGRLLHYASLINGVAEASL